MIAVVGPGLAPAAQTYRKRIVLLVLFCTYIPSLQSSFDTSQKMGEYWDKWP